MHHKVGDTRTRVDPGNDDDDYGDDEKDDYKGDETI